MDNPNPDYSSAKTPPPPRLTPTCPSRQPHLASIIYLRLLGAAPLVLKGCGFRLHITEVITQSSYTGAAPLYPELRRVRPSLPGRTILPSIVFSRPAFNLQLSTVNSPHTPTAAAYLTPLATNSSISPTVRIPPRAPTDIQFNAAAAHAKSNCLCIPHPHINP